MATDDITPRKKTRTESRSVGRAELLADARRQLELCRGALRAAIADGAGDYERGQYRAGIRQCEDDIAALSPRKARKGGK